MDNTRVFKLDNPVVAQKIRHMLKDV